MNPDACVEFVGQVGRWRVYRHLVLPMSFRREWTGWGHHYYVGHIVITRCYY